jgi:hypothetical protein
MGHRFIDVRNSVRQHMVDNWLIMLPAEKLSSDAKIVYMVLKKIQQPDFTCMTDARTFYKISGLRMARVKECLNELENFGLIEQYWATKNIRGNDRFTTTFTAYLKDHFLMQGCYNIIPCPHDRDSFPDPQNHDNILNNMNPTRDIKKFREEHNVAKT